MFQKKIISTKLLYVEDEALNALLTKRVLSKLPLTVVHKTNVEDSIAAIKENTFDLALIDIMLMPNLEGGYEVIKFFKENSPQTIIHIASGLEAFDINDKLKDYGIEKYVRKIFQKTYIMPPQNKEFLDYMKSLTI